MNRDRYVDFLRAWAIVLVVLGHWLITVVVREDDGRITAPELLATVHWTQWLTLGFQIMPLFFLAGGHAAAGSWQRARASGGTVADWMGRRAMRLLLPTAVYSGLVLAAVAVCSGVGVDRDTLALVGWAMAMQFWFLPVYLALGALTPLLFAAHRRWGVRVPVALAGAAILVDVLVVAAHTPYVGPLDYVLVWAVAYQLGFCWRDGLLTRGRTLATAMAVAGALGFTALVAAGPFPVSLILVTGQHPNNTDPPSVAMLSWSVAQCGLCLLVAPPMRRLLRRERVWRAVRAPGAVSMTLYLWHMLPVLVLAAAFYLTGLAPRPAVGSGEWWVLRVPWLLLLGAVLAVVVVALRPLDRVLSGAFTPARPAADDNATSGAHAGAAGGGVAVRPRSWPLWLGLAASVASLARFAVRGFAPDGRFPLLPALGLALGIALVAAPRRKRDAGPGEPQLAAPAREKAA